MNKNDVVITCMKDAQYVINNDFLYEDKIVDEALSFVAANV